MNKVISSNIDNQETFLYSWQGQEVMFRIDDLRMVGDKIEKELERRGSDEGWVLTESFSEDEPTAEEPIPKEFMPTDTPIENPENIDELSDDDSVYTPSMDTPTFILLLSLVNKEVSSLERIVAEMEKDVKNENI